MKCSKPFLEVLRYLPDESTPQFVDLIKNWGGLDWQKLIRLKEVTYLCLVEKKTCF